MKTINFSGYQWNVKDSGKGTLPPADNHWNDENVWVDEEGKLHLSVKWNPRLCVYECSQVELTKTLGYGEYIFWVDGKPDLMDENLVLGLYTYEYFSDPDKWSEIDIELSRWGDSNNFCSQFCVQPSWISGHKERFDIDTGNGTYTTHAFRWNQGVIDYLSAAGHHYSMNDAYNIKNVWQYKADDVPKTLNETTRINFWLQNGLSPNNKQDHEIVISRFDFKPTLIV